MTHRPHQHSASWWPRLFADDATDVAWDDAPKNYTDLPPTIAAAAAAEAAREDAFKREQEERREAKMRLQVGCWWARVGKGG
jgi:ribosomal protein L12E/L44/L45/RPP1/RPP2